MENVGKNVCVDSNLITQKSICAACGNCSNKLPTLYVSLNIQQVLKRAQVETLHLKDPFEGKKAGSFLLFTDCRSKTRGCSVIFDVNRYGKRQRSSLQSWKRRTKPIPRKFRECYICEILVDMRHLEFMHDPNKPLSSVLVNLRTYAVLLCSNCTQELFFKELIKRSGIQREKVGYILNSIADTRFFTLHYNHVQHSVETYL